MSTVLTTTERHRPGSLRDSVRRLFALTSNSRNDSRPGMFDHAQNTSIQNATFTINQYGALTVDHPLPVTVTVADGQTASGSTAASSRSQEYDPSPRPRRESPDIYVDCLLTKNRGYPLWIPSPNSSLPAYNRTLGVSVGDVGVLTPEGGFDYVFNIFHGAAHPINAALGVPDAFTPFTPAPAPTDTQQFVEWKAGSFLADTSIIRVDDGRDHSTIILEATGTESAVLMIPENIHTTKLKMTTRLRKYVEENIVEWYRFVKHTLGHDIENGDLRVVYGCRKSTGFGIATAFNTGRRENTRLSFSVEASWADVPECPYRWSHTGSAEAKAGHSREDNIEVSSTVPIRNQCLFVNTIDVKVSAETWKMVELSTVMQEMLGSTSGEPNPGKHGPTAKSDASGSTANSSSPPCYERAFHPSAILQDILETVAPGLPAYIVCDDDWAPFVSDSTSNACDIVDQILEQRIIVEEQGMLFFCAENNIDLLEEPGERRVAHIRFSRIDPIGNSSNDISSHWQAERSVKESVPVQEELHSNRPSTSALNISDKGVESLLTVATPSRKLWGFSSSFDLDTSADTSLATLSSSVVSSQPSSSVASPHTGDQPSAFLVEGLSTPPSSLLSPSSHSSPPSSHSFTETSISTALGANTGPGTFVSPTPVRSLKGKTLLLTATTVAKRERKFDIVNPINDNDGDEKYWASPPRAQRRRSFQKIEVPSKPVSGPVDRPSSQKGDPFRYPDGSREGDDRNNNAREDASSRRALGEGKVDVRRYRPIVIDDSDDDEVEVPRERISREEARRLMNWRSPKSSSPSGRESKSSLLDNKPMSLVQMFLELKARTVDQSLDTAENNRTSILTTQTDLSTEDAVVFTAHKKTMSLPTSREEQEAEKEFGRLDRLQFDFGSKFSPRGGWGLSASDIQVDSADLLSVSQTHSRPASIVSTGSSGIKVGDVDVDMDMKSALDRLMEDVTGAGEPAEEDDSMMTDEFDESFDRSMDRRHRDRGRGDVDDLGVGRPRVVERAATDSVLLQRNEAADGILSRTVSSSSGTLEMPVPPKDNIRQREQKWRQAQRLKDDEDDDVMRSPRIKGQQLLGVGRPSRRRSISTGDAETLGEGAKKRGDTLLEIATAANNRPLSDDIKTELKKPPKKSKYHVREDGTTIYATSSEDKILQMAGPGDINTNRPWRAVRRPSDMNEYAQQIREWRALEKNKACGKVFVKVLGIRHMNLPLPQAPTVVTCTLNNGIHFVTTPECELSSDCRIDQEFELIEHSKLEFTLTLKVRRDPHIVQQFKSLAPSAPRRPPQPISRPPSAVPPVKSSDMRIFFSSSPQKSSKVAAPPPPPVQQQIPTSMDRLPENLARHLKSDGTLARACINFKDIASRCDTRLFETSYPLIGQRVGLGGKFSTLEVGEIVLQVFRLPPLPDIPQDQQPQSLEECQRGLGHINWHKVTYFEGTLTQNGGDCSTWRRRSFYLTGSNLVAFNDVTKRAVATIDLKQAISVEDDQEPRRDALSPASGHRARYGDEYDGLSGVKNSFRVVFPDDQEIHFFADSDADKMRWLEVLRALIGRIPPHPLWAELLWQRQRQQEITKRATASRLSLAPSSFDPARRP